MAKCCLCSTKKGKRYCSPLDKVICPTCCATNRLKKIDCNEDCRYLSGVDLQIKRAEEKEFSELMRLVPRGQYDDIFKEPAVAFMSYEIETFISDIYVIGKGTESIDNAKGILDKVENLGPIGGLFTAMSEIKANWYFISLRKAGSISGNL